MNASARRAIRRIGVLAPAARRVEMDGMEVASSVA
jgi:hypothetical protein